MTIDKPDGAVRKAIRLVNDDLAVSPGAFLSALSSDASSEIVSAASYTSTGRTGQRGDPRSLMSLMAPGHDKRSMSFDGAALADNEIELAFDDGAVRDDINQITDRIDDIRRRCAGSIYSIRIKLSLALSQQLAEDFPVEFQRLLDSIKSAIAQGFNISFGPSGQYSADYVLKTRFGFIA